MSELDQFEVKPKSSKILISLLIPNFVIFITFNISEFSSNDFDISIIIFVISMIIFAGVELFMNRNNVTSINQYTIRSTAKNGKVVTLDLRELNWQKSSSDEKGIYLENNTSDSLHFPAKDYHSNDLRKIFHHINRFSADSHRKN